MQCPKCHADNPDTSRFCANCAARLDSEPLRNPLVTKTIAAVHGLGKGTMVAEKYRIIEEMGRGGMGVVYKAEDVTLQRTVALKFLPSQWTSDPEARLRFVHEARAASALDHPNICTIHEIGETEDGRMFIAMGCYEGESLRDRLRRGPLEAEEALGIATQIALGMERAHAKGIIHRDIKPANVLITPDGVAKIVDFGLAKLAGQVRMTKEGSTVGTVAYMSPEQAKGEPVDQRTDIWSLGVVLYEMISGRLPFKGDYEQSLIHSILATEPGPLGKTVKGFPRGLEPIVLKALEKNPAVRYQSMGEVREDLKAVAEGLRPLRARAGVFRGRVVGIRKIHAYAALGVLAAIALSVALNVGGLRKYVPGSAQGPRVISIAVLPVKNSSGDPGQEFFAEGITDELITCLGQIQALSVKSLRSVMHYKGTNETVPQIAKELGVERIVEASVIRSGGRVSITARLLDARKDRQLWTRQFDREMTDVFALRSELVQAISGEIRVRVTSQESERLKKAPPVNPDAYEAFLRGKYFLRKWSEDGTKKALIYLLQSIGIEPTFASAYAGLADAYSWAGTMNLMPRNEASLRAREAAQKALDLDENLAEGHAVMSTIALGNWSWAEAERECRRAIALNPNSFDAHYAYGLYLALLGRSDEAVREARRSLELDPMTPTSNMQLGWVLYYADRYDESIAQLKKTLEMDPGLWGANMELSWNYAQKKMYPQAVAECRRALRLNPENPDLVGSCGRVFALAGERAEALKCLEKLKGLSARKEMGNPMSAAWLYDGLGDIDRSVECLEQAYRERSSGLAWIKTETYSKRLRSDPRFQDLLRRMNFPK